MGNNLPLKIINKNAELLSKYRSSARKLRKSKKEKLWHKCLDWKRKWGDKKLFLSGSELTRIFSEIFSDEKDP